MKNILTNLKKRKGFTLVEVIIVLVIIAILMAVLIPSLAGYIDKANEKSSMANCRNFVMAAQTIASETYGTGSANVEKLAGSTDATYNTTKYLTDSLVLAELINDGTALADAPFKMDVTMTKKGKLTKVMFQDGNFLVTYESGNFTVVDTTTSGSLSANKVTVS